MSFRGLRRWRNKWGNQHCEAAYYQPRVGEELLDEAGATAKAETRHVGGSFAWSALVPVRSGDRLVDTTRLDRVLEIDEQAGVVHAQAGIRLEELIEETFKHGLSLHSPPIFDQLTLGGAVSVAAHGSGQQFTTLSDSVVGMTLVDAAGVRRVLPEAGAPREDWNAARAALGTLGVIESIKLECDREFRLEVVRGQRHIWWVIRELDDLLKSYEFVEFTWFMGLPRFAVTMANRTNAPVDEFAWSEIASQAMRDSLTGVFGDFVVPFFLRHFPRRLAPFLRTIYAVFNPLPRDARPSDRHRSTVASHLPLDLGLNSIDDPESKDGHDEVEAAPSAPAPAAHMTKQKPGRFERAVEWVARVLDPFVYPDFEAVVSSSKAFHYIRKYPKCIAYEIAVPMKSAQEALTFVYQTIQDHALTTGEFPITFGVHVRFTAQSELFLATNHQGPMCHIDITTTDAFEGRGLNELMRGIYEALIERFEGRAHWGKYVPTMLTPNDVRQIEKRFDVAAFNVVRKKFDPRGKFLNKFLRQIFKP